MTDWEMSDGGEAMWPSLANATDLTDQKSYYSTVRSTRWTCDRISDVKISLFEGLLPPLPADQRPAVNLCVFSRSVVMTSVNVLLLSLLLQEPNRADGRKAGGKDTGEFTDQMKTSERKNKRTMRTEIRRRLK